MIKVSHLTIQEKERYLLSNVSFVLSDTGLCNIRVNEKDAEKKIAYVLAGLLQAKDGYIQCDDYIVDTADKQLLYRKQYVANIFDEFIFFPDVSIKDNIVLQYTYSDTEILSVLKQFDLFDIAYESLEEQSFEILVRVVLARICIRKYRSVIFYPDATPYAEHELQQIYHVLNICSSFMLVIVIGKTSLKTKRQIELRNGKIVSDNCIGVESSKQRIQNFYNLSHFAIQKAYRKVEDKYRWVYKIFTCLLCIALFFISILWCVQSLDVVDIEMSMLRKNNTNTFLIEKVAKGNDGKIYPVQREELNDEDVRKLNDLFHNQIFYQYEPIDKTYANAYLEGIYRDEDISIYNQYPVTELKQEQFENIRMIGEVPKSYDEVVVPLNMMDTLFIAYDSDHISKYIGQKIVWYGMNLTISGIFTDYDYIYSRSFYVKNGFMKEHYLSSMKTTPASYKRILANNNYISIDNVKPMENINCYYDGNSIQYNQTIKENEVLLNVGAAINLGFPYASYIQNQPKEYSKILDDYLKYTKKWIGKEIQIQSYTIENEPLNSLKYQKNYIIKGFLINGINIIDPLKKDIPSVVYMNHDVLDTYMVPNVKVKNAVFQSENDDNIKYALTYLDKNDEYKAKLDNSSYLQLLIVDVKNLSLFFLIIGLIFLIGDIALSFVLVTKINRHMKKVYSVYYGFGESIEYIKEQIKYCFLEYWKKSLFLSTGIITFVIWSYLLVIFVTLSLDTSLLRYFLLLICPICIAFLLYKCVSILMKVYLKKHKLLMEAYEDVC